MGKFSRYALELPRVLLPRDGVDLTKWSVIACDQFTSQPAWWDEAARLIGDAPSTLNLIFPEAWLKDAAPDIPALHAAMNAAREQVLRRAVDAFVLVERETTRGNRLGLVAAIDLEQYDYRPGTSPLIRSTEDTVAERLPPRVAIRRGAALELPHVMVLLDDPGRTLIEPLYAARAEMPPLYDFELMQGAGHIRGWAVADEALHQQMLHALARLGGQAHGFLFAVGDGNHSLAAARDYWLEIRNALPESERAAHPARCALVELTNLYDDALVFEPIHRAVFGADAGAIQRDFAAYCRARGLTLTPCAPEHAHLFLDGAPLHIEHIEALLPVAVLQPFLDDWLSAHPAASIDYIHGEAALHALDAVRIGLTPMDKRALFPAVRAGGALPRKTFSMGEAIDKRFYLESRSLG